MDILLTNDDGIGAEGLRAAAQALAGEHRCVVAAPSENCSGGAWARTVAAPIAVEETTVPYSPASYAVSGTPVDCVRLVLAGLVEGFRPDLVLSGINHGTNLAAENAFSGTVSAAFEATVLGVAGVAVSQQVYAHDLSFRWGDPADFRWARCVVTGLADAIAAEPLPPGVFLNVNVPVLQPRGVAFTRVGRRIYDDRLRLEQSSGGRPHYRVYGNDPSPAPDDESDLSAIASDMVSITPMLIDHTAHDLVLGSLRATIARRIGETGPKVADGR